MRITHGKFLRNAHLAYAEMAKDRKREKEVPERAENAFKDVAHETVCGAVRQVNYSFIDAQNHFH